MDMKKLTEKLKPFTPVLAAGLVAGCVGISLSGYQSPVYATGTEDTEKEEETEETQVEAETQAAQGSFDLEDGVYQGSGTGYGGTVTVAVQIKDKSIVSIEVISNSDDAAFFNRATAVIDEIIQTQSLDVDVVSGATYSSNGIINAVKNALTGETDSGETGQSQSGGTAVAGSSTTVATVEDAAAYKDGTYYGTGTGFAGPLTVKVVISDGKISSIEITETSDGSSYIQSASSLINTIISSQSTNVDTVSGATYSSVGIIEAVRNALSQAATDATSSSDTSSDTSTDSSSDTTDNSSAVTGTVPYDDGIYYGTAEGYNGDITVAVVIQDKTIKAILVLDTEDDETFFDRAMTVVTNIVKNQNTDVDVVSGATYSSNGLINAINSALEDAERVTNGGTAINNADGTKNDGSSSDDSDEETTVDVTQLDKFIAMAEALNEEDYTEESWTALQEKLAEAKKLKETISSDTQTVVDQASSDLSDAISGLVKADGTEDTSVYNNGSYTVTVVCNPDDNWDFEPYNLTLTMTLLNDQIVAITDVEQDGGRSNTRYINLAISGDDTYTGVVDQIVNSGTLEDIDVVSGATCTSNSIIEACQTALEQAKR